ncbi:MAG: relaxase/mobilization nuclease domain-containing protein [Oceanicaulis sp.]|uniref:relaxase/mobilization nuclease domain-containing protein n=1 Tax=Glycocaulis sp. TaxID=1969725 RepID=UPI0025B815A2|nr:relaxase/mobilization nuclease domain-containing protein [Glycocaulis sp.]MCC5981165.1 relaxase/mobilization nuclease domain-containing protein [Oceanicaulis sp.]MCH8522832.1 relaxase/mobilization nuclease domain-containing protein [Glycocaulis sp.]
MIIKGKSRGGPKQLATHLLRADTNERVTVLELQSTHTELADAFKEWQMIAGGTQGKRGLYHANIDPDARYTMTAEQWHRSVEVLERELGLDGQPRAVVLHEKHGRQHLHVVWQRTDIETMTLVSDSQNYRAHEDASKALEEEFGHERVPGKHSKRDPDRALPEAEINHAEWQQAERTGIDPRVFKDQVTMLYQASDSGAAFQQALDAQGLIIARGDRRGFVLVDPYGEVHSLARQIRGVTATDLRAFMADIDSGALPDVAAAKAFQRERPLPAPVPPEPLAKTPETPLPADGTDSGISIDEALRLWHREDMDRLAEFHAAELQRRADILDERIAARLAKSEARRAEALALYDANAERKGWARVVDQVIGFVAPGWAEQRQADRDEARAAAVKAIEAERVQETARLDAARAAELADLAERQAQQARERDMLFDEELVRRVRNYEEAQRLVQQLAEQERQREEMIRQRAQELAQTSGPEPPDSAR